MCTFLFEQLEMDHIYAGLVLLRFALVFVPQYGYIHPDEFFQSTEVVAGDIFDIEVTKPWEFTSFPIRSVSMIYTLYGLPLKLLKIMGEFYPGLVSAYWVLVVPRLVTTFLSLFIDLALYKLCRCYDLSDKFGLQFLASSYVMLTYLTRTFTNTIEAILFALLLVIVYSDETIESFTKYKFVEISADMSPDHKKKSESAVMQLKYLRSLNKVFCLNAISIGIVGMAGLYNRPTFALLAIFPALVYCEAKEKKIIPHAFLIGVGAMVAMIFLTIVDTLYFRKDFNELLNECDAKKTSLFVCYFTTFLKSVVITPYNFLLYNMNPHHLEEHGIHPRYLHFTVNLFLLFGPLTLLFYRKLKDLILMVWRQEKFHRSYLPAVMLFVPVVCLSIFPHQEPRFLIPLLPLAVLVGLDHIQICKHRPFFIRIWLIFNLSLGLIYGFLHQGGVTQSLLQIEKHVNNQTATFKSHDAFIFYRTYMPPNSLVLSKNANSQILDARGVDLQQFLKDVPKRLSKNENYQKNKDSSRIFVLTPSVVVREMKEKGIRFVNETTFYGHLSTEDLPNLGFVYNSTSSETSFMGKLSKFVSSLSNEMSLQQIRMNYRDFDHDDNA